MLTVQECNLDLEAQRGYLFVAGRLAKVGAAVAKFKRALDEVLGRRSSLSQSLGDVAVVGFLAKAALSK